MVLRPREVQWAWWVGARARSRWEMKGACYVMGRRGWGTKRCLPEQWRGCEGPTLAASRDERGKLVCARERLWPLEWSQDHKKALGWGQMPLSQSQRPRNLFSAARMKMLGKQLGGMGVVCIQLRLGVFSRWGCNYGMTTQTCRVWKSPSVTHVVAQL